MKYKDHISRYYTAIYWIIIRLIAIIPSQYFRKIILKYIFRINISLKAVLYSGFKISNASKIEVGAFSVIGLISIMVLLKLQMVPR